MKKILILLSIIVSIVSVKAQTLFPVNQSIGNATQNNLLYTINGGGYASVGFIDKSYVDSTAANLNTYLKNYAGARFFSTSENATYIRSSDKQYWIKQAGGAAVGTVTSVGLSVPSVGSPFLGVSGTPVTTSGTLALSALGTTGQYVRGDGSLATTAGITVPINNLLAATGTNSINNAGYLQTWNWDGALTIGLNMGANPSTTMNGSNLLKLDMTGANSASGHTTVTGLFNNLKTGTSSTNIAGQFSASGGTNNYAILVPSGSGSVGIGLNPNYKLDVLENAAGVFAANIYNSHADGAGLGVRVNNSVVDRSLLTAYSGSSGATKRFEVTADGKVSMHSIANTVEGNVLFYNTSTKAVTYGTANTGTVTGTGTLNYVPKWNPNGTTLDNSQIYEIYNSSPNVGVNFIGISTTAPTAKLDVSYDTASMYLPNTSGSTNTAIQRIGFVDHSWDGVELDIGLRNGGDYPAWIQARKPTDYSVQRPLLINPNGGDVLVGGYGYITESGTRFAIGRSPLGIMGTLQGTVTNDSVVGGRDGIVVNTNSVASVSGNYSVFGISSQTTSQTVNAGITDLGMRVGVTGDAYSQDTTFKGTLQNQTGVRGRAGFGGPSGGSGTVTNAYGGLFEIRSETVGGTIVNAYGVYIDYVEDGGTITNQYDLYASTANAKNYFAGSVGIGVNPTSKLHVVPVQTTGIGVAFASSTTTSGTILDVTGTSTALAANNEGLNIGISGVNGTNAITATGARISVTNTNATSGTNVGLDLTASGATTANNALNITVGAIGLNGSAGTTGQVLTSAGANTLPTWTTPTTVATAVPISGLTASTGTNSITVGHAQTWNYNGITTGIGHQFTSNSITSGSIMDITGTSTALASGNKGLNIAISGANGTSGITATAANFSISNTGTTNTNYAINSSSTGAVVNYGVASNAVGSNSSYGGYFTASGGSAINYGVTGAAGGANARGGYFSISTTGATTYGVYSDNQNQSGTTAYGLYAQSQGVNTTNIAGHFTASGATTNNALNIAAGALTLNSSAGTSGQVLTSAGASTLPTWTTPTTGTVTSVSGTANQIASTGGATPVLSLVSGGTLPGAWTVAADADYIGGNWNVGQLKVGGKTNENKRISIGFSTADDFGFIQAGESGVAYKDLLLQPAGSSVGIGTTAPAASAILDVTSTTKGFLPPRWTNAQMAAVSSPATGLHGYNTDAKMAVAYNGTAYISPGVVSGSFSQVGTATTTFTVTFGGTQPNATYKVNVTPTAVLSAAYFYVSNKTTTTFDVNYLAGLTGTVTFDYAIFQ